ncbi:cellulose binding domain-containing protein [Streptomonospora nanhaiensis]|uniref:CBM2 domain-containing protein n=1 Tax=Streptomonospora nanhaiensis TaxID=1323731 RepID=A0A853BV10_9ACTN|nr:cellulose binding domain-containing protein [Streptomonospora nanhaiensis]MBV2362591.1 cellulose-binding domain-containing protein [Streptomonospora nanhaiensis]MBX9386870.1 cellulose-binding domain-containing protein [Streptomonospora nanhaiensis]NYI98062.1 hypothetical protein [Streptomonospora nanhaiensis]
MRAGRRDPLAERPRRGGSRTRESRGAHRAEPANPGGLAAVGYFLGSTVPKRVQPPRLINVLLVSGVTLALTLFGYSTTQIYLRFSDPPDSGSPAPGAGERVPPTAEADAAQPGTGPGGSADSASSTVSVVSYETVESSATGFTGAVTVTNTGTAVLADWELALEFADATVTSVRDVDWRATEHGVVARAPDSSDGLGPGESVTLSFTAAGTAQAPVTCALNGRPCDLAGE